MLKRPRWCTLGSRCTYGSTLGNVFYVVDRSKGFAAIEYNPDDVNAQALGCKPNPDRICTVYILYSPMYGCIKQPGMSHRV